MAQAALDAKADEVVILNLKKLSFSFDYFFLCTASSERRIQTVADHIQERLAERGQRRFHQEGRAEGGWILLDYGAVVGHVFSPQARQFYQLERLWADAPRLLKIRNGVAPARSRKRWGLRFLKAKPQSKVEA